MPLPLSINELYSERGGDKTVQVNILRILETWPYKRPVRKKQYGDKNQTVQTAQ